MIKNSTPSVAPWKRAGYLAPLLLLLVMFIAPVHADDDHDRAKRLQDAGKILPLETILKSARAIHPGRVLEIELEKKRGRYIYEVEIIDRRGIVWEMKFDAKTGRLLKSKREK